MSGKILKITSNDLYGNVDDRNVVVFACFEHTKYMNNYVVFAFEGEYGKKKIGYGSVHLKKNSIVIFSVKDNSIPYIEQFLSEYINDNVENFKILDIEEINKVELVSYNEMDCDNLELLDEKSISKVILNQEVEEKGKNGILYLILVVLILFAGGISLLYFYPEIFDANGRELVCSNEDLYDQELMLYYDIKKDIKFDNKDKVVSIDVSKVYKFLDSNEYYEFKDNGRLNDYFNNGEAYKFIDDGLNLKVMYDEAIIIDDYEEIRVYMKREGFNCEEKDYEK